MECAGWAELLGMDEFIACPVTGCIMAAGESDTTCAGTIAGLVTPGIEQDCVCRSRIIGLPVKGW